MIKRAKRFIKRTLKKLFTKKNLEDNGERVDINYYSMNFDHFDVYQKSHFKRYQFAQSYISPKDVVGDFACGSGYGSMILSEKAKTVIGGDINKRVISIIRRKYKKKNNIKFIHQDITKLNYKNHFNSIVSFETIEHLHEQIIPSVFQKYHEALKENGLFIFSTPYDQEKSEEAINMGFHLTFNITEETIQRWMQSAGFKIEGIRYQNYETHNINEHIGLKHFIICIARKI